MTTLEKDLLKALYDKGVTPEEALRYGRYSFDEGSVSSFYETMEIYVKKYITELVNVKGALEYAFKENLTSLSFEAHEPLIGALNVVDRLIATMSYDVKIATAIEKSYRPSDT